MQVEPAPKVSVCVVTYNQEKYIGQCLQSLVDQQTDFPFEIIVGDDCSTDGTREIVEEFRQKYPKLIRTVFRETNIGAVANLVDVYKRASGKYIAHMDGDDFASPNKIQQQVEALESNKDCTICSHDVFLVDAKSKKFINPLRHHKSGVNSLMDLYAALPFFTHSSKMFLNDASDSFYDELDPHAIDAEIHIAQAKRGNIYHIPCCLGSYRMMVGVSYQSGVINPMIPAAIRRLYNSALVENGRSRSEINMLKHYYANAILNFGYHSALAGEKSDYIKYTRESVKIRWASSTQFAMYFFTISPGLAIFMARMRSRFARKEDFLGWR